MLVSRVVLRNWRNFREVDVPLRERTYLLGPNASGKSNFLDVFRFLRDISKSQGGGLQKALLDRGGVTKLRCLHARSSPAVHIEIELSETADAPTPKWRYVLAFKSEGKGQQRTLISCEEVWNEGIKIVARPDSNDHDDDARLTQTLLEQIQANAPFRDIAEFLGSITYLHLVPQLLKYGDRIGGQRLEDDPFGQGFLERIAHTPDRVRIARLSRIEKVLKIAVPRFSHLKFERDEIGRPHLVAQYEHHRPRAGWQREEHFSDGTLRLIGLLWSLLDGDSLLLLEEPELSLNDGIVSQIPVMLHRVQREKKRRQIILSTHSEALLSNTGIDSRGVLQLQPAQEGTTIKLLSAEQKLGISAGLSVAEVALPFIRPSKADQLRLF